MRNEEGRRGPPAFAAFRIPHSAFRIETGTRGRYTARSDFFGVIGGAREGGGPAGLREDKEVRMTWRRWAGRGVAGVAALACAVGSASAQGTAPAAPAPAAAPARPAAAADLNKVVATVNGEAITWGDLDAVLKMAGPDPLQLPEAQQKERQKVALNMLIDNVLMHQFLLKTTAAPSAADVDKKLAEMETALKQQKKTLAQICAEMHLSPAKLREDVADHLRWAEYVRGHVTDAALEQYFKEYKDFFDRVLVRCSHIVLRLPPGAPEADKAQAKAKLQEVRAQIAANKLDFAEAAKKFSQCPTAERGGDLGYIPRKSVTDDVFARTAFAMQPGQVSDVVQTDYGYHLIKVTERKPGQPQEYAKIKDQVREVYAEEMAVRLVGEQHKNAKVEIHLP
jgi:parvulin-like peptidyl-prolyl isomerase